MNDRELKRATELIISQTAAQARALFPRAPRQTINVEAAAWVHKALDEARQSRLAPDAQVAYVQQRADDAIRLNLAEMEGVGTMH